LHYSGVLLEWLEERHPEFFDQLRELCGRGQVELLGGGYYEPILLSIPIETISQSELGFERVYQGSAILAVWKIDPASWRDVTGVLRAEVAPWAGPARDDDNGA
jgi:alpha-mannosidase